MVYVCIFCSIYICVYMCDDYGDTDGVEERDERVYICSKAVDRGGREREREREK